MSERSIKASIKSKLIANEPFQYAHLVKFERPFDPKDGSFRTNANRYAYYTDAAHDIEFNDGNGAQTYRANRITSIGQYSETTIAKATSMNLTLAAEDLGATVVVAGSISASGATFTPSSTVIDGELLDFVEKGFKEGDKIKFTPSSGTSKTHIITGFSSNNTVISLAVTGTDSDDDALADSTSTFTITLESDELTAVLQERGITTTSTAEANPNFLHRKVDIHKVFIEPDTGAIVGSASILVFRGIIASVNIKETPTNVQVTWQLTSHWGDFEAIQGRITTDELHRALNPDGSPNKKQAIRDEYAADLGFLHAETSLNTIANYKDYVTKFRTENKRRGGPAGFFGGTYAIQHEYQEEVEREVDLNIHLGGKQLPVVYGVQKLGGIPVMADTLKNDSKVIYVVHALSEGEIHGIYNTYIDDIPLICTDDSDYDVRNTTNGTDKDSSQLQCYGNMSWGATLNAAVVELETAKADIAQQTGTTATGLTGKSLSIWLQRNSRNGNAENAVYVPTSRTDINGQVLSTGMANGMQHEESFSISHPYTMAWSFHSGRPNQLANNHLITIAEESGGGFKRQADYYTGNLPYWAEGHRLLDTAYAVTRFEIEPDATEIPEVEYVVKGKVLECYNYDASYIPDAALGTSDDAGEWAEGDLVTVQYSTDGSSWTDDTSGDWTNNTFKILYKYTFTTSRGTSHIRLMLDKTPNLGIVNGTPTRTRLRLKSGNNYWHMVTWNHGQITSETTWPNDTWKTPTSWATNGSGELTATVSGSDKTFLDVYGSESAFFQFRKSSWAEEVSGLEYAVLRGTWSGNTVTFPNTDFNGVTTSDLTNAQIATSTILPFAQVGTSITNALQNDIKGCFLKNTTTGEERQITDFNTSTNNITIESPFFTPSYDAHKFTITGRGRDSRASSNPAIQTLDYISSKRYGKNLTHDDLDLDSFITSAKLCDTRSDVIIKVASAANVAVNDIFTLTLNGQSGGAHVASGKVLSVDTTNNTVTLTQVINKFLRKYSSYTTYAAGDIVYTTTSKFYRAVQAFSPTTDTEPSHTSGTTTYLEYIGDFESGGNITIYKTAGNGTAASLNIVKTDNPIEYSLYDADWVKYWRYHGWEHHHQMHATRHQTNFILDTGKSVFANMNALLSHYNGILSYENGKYVLNVETQETAPTPSLNSNQENTNPYYIEKEDIIGGINLKDNSQRNAKNTIKASIADPQNNYGSRSITFYNSDFLEADRNIQKTGQFPYTGITNYYNGRIGAEKELFQTRFSKEISFTIGPRGILLRAGQVIAINYEPFGWTSKMFRIENLSFAADCNVTVKAREYDDSIYEITKQQANLLVKESAAQYALSTPSAPSSLTATTNKSGSVLIAWANATDYAEISDSTEIWYSSDNNRANATLLATVDKATNFAHNPAGAETKYYWIRHRRISSLTQSNAKTTVHSSYFPTSATGGVTGTSTSLSAGATSIKLLPSSYVIDWNERGSYEDDTISFTVETNGMEGTIYYEFLVGSTSKQNTTGATWTLPDADEPGPYDAPIKVTVKARQGTSDNSTILATDVVSIYSVQNGQNTVTGILTNEAHTQVAAVDGTVSSFSSAGGNYKVYWGNSDITSNAKCTFAVLSESGVDVSIDAATGAYTVSSMSADIGTATFRATVKGSIAGGIDGTDDVTRDKVYTISKAKAGATGATGAGGSDAKTVKLTAADYSIVYDANGATPDPSSTITLTASSQNFTDGYFKFTGDGISDETSFTNGSGANADTFTFSVPAAHFTTPKTLRVGVAEASADTTEVAFDTISIYGVKPGVDGYTVICSNETHAIPAASDGSSPTMTGSGCSFEVFAGGTQLTGITSGTPSSSQFKVTVTDDTNITVGSQSASSNLIVFADHSSMAAATASITYSINIANTNTVEKKQTFSRTNVGATGASGDKNATAIMYQATSSDSAPAVINDTSTYTFATGVVSNSNGLDSWSNTIPSDASAKYLWTTQANVTATAAASTASIVTGAWSTPVKQALPHEARSQRVVIYNPSTAASGVTEPTDTTSGTPFNFATNVLTIGSGGTAGWTNTQPSYSVAYWMCVVNILSP